MESLRQLGSRFAGIFRRRNLEAEMAEEMRQHLERRTQEKIADGFSPAEARNAAQREFGGIAQLQEQCRDERRFGWLEDLLCDGHFSLRAFSKRENRGFVAIAVLTLALGIGATTTVFSVVYGLLANPFPYKKPGEIWSLSVLSGSAATGMATIPFPFYTELAKLPAIEMAMASKANGLPGLELDNNASDSQPLPYSLITGNGFNFLGVPPLLGRTIQPFDILPDGSAAPVAVLSYKAAQKLFPDDPNPIGKTITLKDASGARQPKTVIGIMPPFFGEAPIYDLGNSMWLPMAPGGPERGNNVDGQKVWPRLRLKPGIPKAVAESQIHALLVEMSKDRLMGFGWNFDLATLAWEQTPFRTTLRGIVEATFDQRGILRASLRVLFFAVSVLLVIACANVSNLQLAKAISRRREIGIRLALGCSRGRLVRQLLTESVLLSLAGGVFGVALAYALIKVTVALMPAEFGAGMVLPHEGRIAVEGPVLVFALVVACLSGILFGLLPAFQSTRQKLNETLQEGGVNSSTGVAPRRWRNLLVIAEVGLSIVLLFGGSLTLFGYTRMLRADPGFEPEGLYVVNAPRPPEMDRRLFWQELLTNIRSLPQVEAADVGAVPQRSTLNFAQSGYAIEGQPRDVSRKVSLHTSGADFLRTLRVPLLEGRNFSAEAVARGERVALISQSVRGFWPEGDTPIGKQITLDTAGAFTIVGVFGDLRQNIAADPVPFVVLPYTTTMDKWETMSVIFRARAGDSRSVLSAVRARMRLLNPNMQPGGQGVITTFSTQFALPRFNFALFCTMAGVALALACAGIFGVVSYHVTQRTREIGVRIALGAGRGNVIRMILGDGARLLGLGLLAGSAGCLALLPVIKSQTAIFRVPAGDPLVIGTVMAAVALLSVVVLFACLAPAWRAARVDPMVALKTG